MLADEPVAAGGEDTGPGPYDFLLAGLGACTSMTLRLYADRKALPLERVTVTLKHSKIHAEDCTECETRTGMLDQIERAIAMEGALDAEQRRKLMEIADKCPVHRTLTSEVRIVTTATAAETIRPSAMDDPLTMVFQPPNWASRIAPAAPVITPMMPPIIEMMAASIRNCIRMSRGVAPIALRMPISRVRSVTETSMMFIIPMPPTTSEMTATALSRLVMVSATLAWRCMISVWLVI